MTIHFDKIQDLVGFAAENKKGPGSVKIMTRASFVSDDPEFCIFAEKISDIFLNKAQVPTDYVHQFLVVIHKDQSADLYVNDIYPSLEISVKRNVKKGEAIFKKDIADIRKIRFPKIQIIETDKIIYCFKVGWRFGLFFDLSPRVQPDQSPYPVQVIPLDIEKMETTIAEIYRYLSFYHVYKILESEIQFDEMIKDGWFPFIEILSGEYKTLTEMYQNKFDFENKIKFIIDGFDKTRIKQITEKWWDKTIFNDKKTLIEPGLNAFLQNDQQGFISCINNLYPPIEGVLRASYFAETGKGNNVKSKDLISYIIEKGKHKTGSDYSLFLPVPFLTYLQDIVFANFNLETGKIDLSRNSSSHGVAQTDQYSKSRALQMILILDQIYFYI